MDDGIVDRDESVCFEEVEEFVKEVIGVLVDELKEILCVIVVEMSKAASESLLLTHNIAGFAPEL
jgi:hypothetical protein